MFSKAFASYLFHALPFLLKNMGDLKTKAMHVAM